MPIRKWLKDVDPAKREVLEWVEETLESNKWSKAELISLILEFIETDAEEFKRWQNYKEHPRGPIWRAKEELSKIGNTLIEESEYIEFPKEIQTILSNLPETGMGYQTIVNGQFLLI